MTTNLEHFQGWCLLFQGGHTGYFSSVQYDTHTHVYTAGITWHKSSPSILIYAKESSVLKRVVMLFTSHPRSSNSRLLLCDGCSCSASTRALTPSIEKYFLL